MNNKEFIAEINARTNKKNAETQRLMSLMLTAMGDAFLEGNTVQIANFGTFEVKKKMERVIVNPTNGLRMLVPPKLVLGFKPNANWKDKVKNGGE